MLQRRGREPHLLFRCLPSIFGAHRLWGASSPDLFVLFKDAGARITCRIIRNEYAETRGTHLRRGSRRRRARGVLREQTPRRDCFSGVLGVPLGFSVLDARKRRSRISPRRFGAYPRNELDLTFGNTELRAVSTVLNWRAGGCTTKKRFRFQKKKFRIRLRSR